MDDQGTGYPDSVEVPSPLVATSDIRGGYPWSVGIIDEDPMFVDPENGDYHLLPGSPCIGTGAGGFDMGALMFADIDGDHKVDAVDVQFIINTVLSVTTSVENDIDGDGTTNATDIQLVINTVLGL